MKAKNWQYGVLIVVLLGFFVLVLMGFCFPKTFSGTVIEKTDTYFTIQSQDSESKAMAVVVKWPDTPVVKQGDTITVTYYRKNHGAPRGLYASKIEVIEKSEFAESKVKVQQGGKTYDLYRLIVYSYGYMEDSDSFASGTGARLRNILSDEAEQDEVEKFPVFQWTEDFSLDVPEDLQLSGIEIYNENGEEAAGTSLSELPAGTYYVGVEVYREGAYMEEKGEHEYSGEQYIFCLVKP